ncbi:MAG: hypothetical protein LC657_01705 [Desulfobacteraceae bacterium]|nr:hypothetical protein [Desulfobacteraceae bacterium]
MQKRNILGVTSRDVIIRSVKHAGLSPGDRVNPGFLWEHGHFFDTKPGTASA